MSPPPVLRVPAIGALPLWPIALLAGLLPAAAALSALAISAQAGHVPACVPFVEGCTSISRAGREGLAKPVFKALMIPAAVLQGLVWVLFARWLAALEGPAGVAAGAARTDRRAIALLGTAGTAALVAYAAFLGEPGAVAEALRRYGTVAYFGFTCLCLLLAGRAVGRLAASGALVPPRWALRALPGLAVALVGLGVANAALAAWLPEPWKDRVQNATEWWGALVFVIGFAAIAALWRRAGAAATVSAAAAAGGTRAAPPARARAH
jgi:hypothetical protein